MKNLQIQKTIGTAAAVMLVSAIISLAPLSPFTQVAQANMSAYTPSSFASVYSPSSYNSQYNPSSYYSQYSPTTNTATYTPSNTTSVYSPSSYTSTYNPSSYYSQYSPSDYYSNYSPSDAHNSSTCATPGSCSSNTSDIGNTIGSYNPCGTPGSCSTTVTSSDSHNVTITNPTQYVPVYSAPKCTLVVTPAVVQPGQTVVLSWSSSNAQYGLISTIGQVNTNGSVVIRPTQPMTFSGQFTSSNGQTVTCATSLTISAPIVYNNIPPAVPYVTLSQVPYTGLDLGPMGLVAYWTFLVLWCLLMAYLVVVKRVQYRLAMTLKGFLFGTDDDDEEEETIESTPAVVEYHHEVTPVPKSMDPIDDFILTQVRRAN